MKQHLVLSRLGGMALLLLQVLSFQQGTSGFAPAAELYHLSRRQKCSAAVPQRRPLFMKIDLSNLLDDFLKENISTTKPNPQDSFSEYSKALDAFQAINDGIPQADEDGIYRIHSEEQYHNFMALHSDKLVILSFMSLYCRACRDLQQKFRLLYREDHQDQADPSHRNYFADADGNKKVVWGEVLISNNPHIDDPFTNFCNFQLGVIKVPTVRFYVHGEEVGRSAACHPKTGCSWRVLKQQILEFIKDYEGFVRVSSSVAAVQQRMMEEETMAQDREQMQPPRVWKLPREVGKRVNKVKPRQPKLQDEVQDWLHKFFNGDD